jgi:hypothetical protein
MQKTDFVSGQWCQSSDAVKQGEFFREELPKALLFIWGKSKWRTVTNLKSWLRLSRLHLVGGGRGT